MDKAQRNLRPKEIDAEELEQNLLSCRPAGARKTC